jgi:hypothetical protein
MTITGPRLTALLLAALVVSSFAGSTAFASIDNRPRVETNCLRSRIVLRPEFGSSLADLRQGEKMPLVQVRLCNYERRSCVADGQEVPFSQCTAASRPGTLGSLTTE